MAGAILSEAALSFLGLGVQPPTPSWGTMINGGRAHLLDAPHLTIFPGVFLAIVVLGFNFVGDGLRDAIDPKIAPVRPQRHRDTEKTNSSAALNISGLPRHSCPFGEGNRSARKTSAFSRSI